MNIKDNDLLRAGQLNDKSTKCSLKYWCIMIANVAETLSGTMKIF